MLARLLTVLSLSLHARLLAGEASCAAEECETEDMSALQHGARLREPARMLDMERQEPKSFEVKEGENASLGLLILDYAYPTQPGDIDDKRTFCTVDNASSPNYKCLDGFSIVKAMVAGLSFDDAQKGTWNATIEEGFTDAVRALMKEGTVKAITSNCGFMTNFLENVSIIMQNLSKSEGLRMKPLLMGTLQLGNVFTDQTGDDDEGPGWNLLERDQRALVVTANSTTLSPRFWSIMEKAGIEDPGLQALRNLSPFEEGTKVSDHPDIENFLRNILKVNCSSFSTLDFEDPALTIGEAIAALDAWVRGKGKCHTPEGVLKHSARISQVLQNSGQFFRIYGAQDIKGFGKRVANGRQHNASEASASMVKWVLDTLFRIKFRPPRNFQGKVGQPDWYKLDTPEVDPVWVVFECTELPVYANAVRMFSRLPVWDITTMSQCMMYAALSTNFSYTEIKGDMRRSQDFKDCMMSWNTSSKFEKRFGLQPNRTLLHYDYDGEAPARKKHLFDWGLLGHVR